MADRTRSGYLPAMLHSPGSSAGSRAQIKRKSAAVDAEELRTNRGTNTTKRVAPGRIDTTSAEDDLYPVVAAGGAGGATTGTSSSGTGINLISTPAAPPPHYVTPVPSAMFTPSSPHPRSPLLGNANLQTNSFRPSAAQADDAYRGLVMLSQSPFYQRHASNSQPGSPARLPTSFRMDGFSDDGTVPDGLRTLSGDEQDDVAIATRRTSIASPGQRNTPPFDTSRESTTLRTDTEQDTNYTRGLRTRGPAGGPAPDMIATGTDAGTTSSTLGTASFGGNFVPQHQTTTSLKTGELLEDEQVQDDSEAELQQTDPLLSLARAKTSLQVGSPSRGGHQLLPEGVEPQELVRFSSKSTLTRYPSDRQATSLRLFSKNGKSDEGTTRTSSYPGGASPDQEERDLVLDFQCGDQLDLCRHSPYEPLDESLMAICLLELISVSTGTAESLGRKDLAAAVCHSKARLVIALFVLMLTFLLQFLLIQAVSFRLGGVDSSTFVRNVHRLVPEGTRDVTEIFAPLSDDDKQTFCNLSLANPVLTIGMLVVFLLQASNEIRSALSLGRWVARVSQRTEYAPSGLGHLEARPGCLVIVGLTDTVRYTYSFLIFLPQMLLLLFLTISGLEFVASTSSQEILDTVVSYFIVTQLQEFLYTVSVTRRQKVELSMTFKYLPVEERKKDLSSFATAFEACQFLLNPVIVFLIYYVFLPNILGRSELELVSFNRVCEDHYTEEYYGNTRGIRWYRMFMFFSDENFNWFFIFAAPFTVVFVLGFIGLGR